MAEREFKQSGDLIPNDGRWLKNQDKLTEEDREKKRQKHQKLAEKFRKKQEAIKAARLSQNGEEDDSGSLKKGY